MTKEKKNMPKVPNLRFPGFEGEWEKKRLEEIGKLIGGGTPSTKKLNLWNGEIPWISSSDITTDDIHNISKTRFITEEAIKTSAAKLIPKGAILMVSRVGIGKFAVADEELCTSQDFTNLITTNNEFFLCYYFSVQSNKFIRLSQGTSIKGFTTRDIKSASFFIPEIEEQNRISNFIATLDSKIQTQIKTIEHLETLIKGVSKKLFSQELRFTGFDDNWEVRKLKDIGKTYNGLSGKMKENFGKGEKYIQYKQVFDSSKIKTENCGLVDVAINENQNQVKYGDVFFTISSETPEEIGMSSVMLTEVENMFLNSFCFGFRIHSFETLLPGYARFLFRSEVFRASIIKLAQGSTRYNMSKKELLKIAISLPSLEEQTKIASFLSSIDEKIETEKAILEQLKNQKKYFLQNLFV